MIPAIDPTKTKLSREWKVGRPLIGCRFDPSGRFLFASAEDDRVHRIDLLSGETVPFAGHQSWVRGIAFPQPLANSRAPVAAWQSQRDLMLSLVGGRAIVLRPPAAPAFHVATGDYHGHLLIWQGQDPQREPIVNVPAHQGWLRMLTVSPDGQRIATCGNDRLVKIWSAREGKPLQTLEGHREHVYHLAYHPREARLVSCDLKGIIIDWDLTNGKTVRELDAKILHKYDTGFRADIGGARAMHFSEDGTSLAVAGITNVSNAFAGVGNPIVTVLNWKDGKARHLKTKDNFQGTAWGVHLHPSGWTIAAGGGNGGRVWFWKGDDLNHQHVLTVPANSRDMAVHPDQTQFAVAGANGVAYLYRLMA